MSWVRMTNVSKYYGETQVLRQINLDISPQEQLVIRGASGSGKSTLLYLLGGLETQTEGEIIVDDMDLTKVDEEELAEYRNRKVGFVFQFHFLLPSMDCLENILLPARLGGLSDKGIKETGLELARYLGVDHCLKKYPYQISGGEQQRINIIRALSLKPKFLLCDEPTGNLDSKNSEKVTQILKELAQSFEATLLVVTHDRKVASHFPKELFMEDGQLYTS